MKKITLMISSLLLIAQSQCIAAKDYKIESKSQLAKAIKSATAGDNIILQNGTYTDVNIVFDGDGSKDKPITLKAQTPGKVFIEGQSSLKLGGSYLHVSGLHFRNGYTPSKTLISFRINKKRAAYHSKITNSVIDSFTQLDREKSDVWIEFWGQHNELSNNYIAGKSNFGPTVRVQLKGNQHVNNYHQIINNHFGPRPRKGGPHGETLQIGDSGTSMTPSYTNIENNLFDRCDGEVEVISSKSNYNQFKNNVFYKSEGSLVLRHGNYANIEGNIFIGDGESKNYGGIRVINTGHWITNNYFYKLKGEKFRAPIAVMNGIPKSPLNRYNQVTDAVVAYNTWVESPTPWYFSVGSNVDQSDVLPKSEIRSARPIRTIFANNLIYNTENGDYPIHTYDKVDGVSFKQNVTNHKNNSEVKAKGIVTKSVEMNQLSEYLQVPNDTNTKLYHGFDFDKISTDLFGNARDNNNDVGAVLNISASNKPLFDRANYGTPWFDATPKSTSPETHKVVNTSELESAISNAKSGDIIELAAKAFDVSKTITVDKALTLVKSAAVKSTQINFSSKHTAFLLLPTSHLTIDGVVLKGTGAQNAFSTLDKNMSKAYDLTILNTRVSNFSKVLDVSKGSFANNITITHSAFDNNEMGLVLNKETKNKGNYNVEFLTVTHSKFDNISGAVIDYHRGGYDESTIGGNLVFENNVVTNSGAKQSDSILIKNRGIVHVSFENNTFKNNDVKLVAILWGEKGQKPVNNTIAKSGEIKIVQNLKLELMY